ncbi:unnamed protein product [Caenorhabditis brenneri]
MRVVLFLLLLAAAGVEAFSDSLEEFLSQITAAVNTGNETLIGELIAPSFYYEGCGGTIRKDQAIAYLKQLQSPNRIQFTLIPGSKAFSGIFLTKFSVSSELDLSTSTFYYQMRDRQLHMGFDQKCALIDYVGKTVANISNLTPREMEGMVQTFLNTMNTKLTGGNKVEIQKLFRPDFSHFNCRRIIRGADKMAEAYADHPPTVPFKLLNVEDVGSSLRIVVTYAQESSLPSDRTQAEFYLNKKYNQLEMGSSLDCEKGIQDGETNLTYVEPDVFMERLASSIAARDFYSIQSFFTSDFEFSSCHSKYNQSQFAMALASIDASTKISFKVVKVEKVGISRKFFTEAIGMTGVPIDVLFYHTPLKHYSGSLISGKVLSCKS